VVDEHPAVLLDDRPLVACAQFLLGLPGVATLMLRS
jgi:hypothetical protein